MYQCDSLTIRLEGDSGDGILSMGNIAARAAARCGFHVYTYATFLAVVRGGQSTFQLRIGRKPLLSQGDAPDILVALNRQAVRNNGGQVTRGGLIMHPPADESLEAETAPETWKLPLDFQKLAMEETGQARAKNMVALGALMRLIGLDQDFGADSVRQTFKKKGSEVIDENLRAFQSGYNAAGNANGGLPDYTMEPDDRSPRMLLSGNEAIALGALVAGIRFFAGYPITPATEIMEWLAKSLPRVGGSMVQAEDEIAALGMCIGASYGGVKSMTATSGPGLSLMTELIGLAGMMETPVVIVDVQRAGPSTGMPTMEGQGDLNIATHGVHGEVPRVVFAPMTVAGCFEQTIQAVNTAHRFHIPVLILSSQSLSHRMQTITPPDPASIEIFEEAFYESNPETDIPFRRFQATADGLPSVRSIPGIPGGMFRATGLEHDELGNPTTDPVQRNKMVARRRDRMKAIQHAFRDDPTADESIEPGAALGVVSWGATASIAREAIDLLRAEGWKISFFAPNVIWPMADGAFERFLGSGIRQLFVCELNATRQFGKMIRARYTPDLVENDILVTGIAKDTGMPFTSAEIRGRILDHISEDLSRRGVLPLSPRMIRERIFGQTDESPTPAAAQGAVQ